MQTLMTEMKKGKIQEYGLVPVNMSDTAHKFYAEDNDVRDSKSRPSSYSSAGFNAGKDTAIHEGIDNSKKSTLQIA